MKTILELCEDNFTKLLILDQCNFHASSYLFTISSFHPIPSCNQALVISHTSKHSPWLHSPFWLLDPPCCMPSHRCRPCSSSSKQHCTVSLEWAPEGTADSTCSMVRPASEVMGCWQLEYSPTLAAATWWSKKLGMHHPPKDVEAIQEGKVEMAQSLCTQRAQKRKQTSE